MTRVLDPFPSPPPISLCVCQHQIFEKQRYGPIYRDGMNSVCVNTAALLEEVLRNENRFPNRGDLSLWREYRDIRGYGYGPFTV